MPRSSNPPSAFSEYLKFDNDGRPDLFAARLWCGETINFGTRNDRSSLR